MPPHCNTRANRVQNDYSWCNTDFTRSGWDQKVKNFTGYGLPIFLSEYGCTSNGRDFGEVGALMSDKMSGVYSGGLLYEYSLEASGYGIVNITNGNAVELAEFDKFGAALKQFPAPTGNGGFVSTTTSQPCPTKDADWLIDSTLLPALPAAAKIVSSHFPPFGTRHDANRVLVLHQRRRHGPGPHRQRLPERRHRQWLH